MGGNGDPEERSRVFEKKASVLEIAYQPEIRGNPQEEEKRPAAFTNTFRG